MFGMSFEDIAAILGRSATAARQLASRGRARAAQLAVVDGAVGAASLAGGQPRVIFIFATENARIVSINLVADPERLRESDLKLLEN